MDELQSGPYDELISIKLKQQIDKLGTEMASVGKLSNAEAADRLALYLSKQIEQSIEGTPENERTAFGATMVDKVISAIQMLISADDLQYQRLSKPIEILRGISRINPDGSLSEVKAPKISLLDTALLTNAPDEPGIGTHIASELASSESVDLVMAFITWGGIQNIRHDLEQYLNSGRSLRILTTTFSGITDQRSLDWLCGLGAEIKVSYTIDASRLHAKAWLFERSNQYSTAYIGSANLTHTALSPGREWNLRVSGIRNHDIIEKVRAVFLSYWENPDFQSYDSEIFHSRTSDNRNAKSQFIFGPVAVHPFAFQERLLDQIEASRSLGHHRNLLVAATGTGKTVMAALDYQSLRTQMHRHRLLFIAHRKEILEQSRATFRQVLHDYDFGELWVGGKHPEVFDNAFASIQSLNATDLSNIDPQYFDVVIVDEFHHAAAASYSKILNHLKPQELLGLTATPERADGQSVLDWFDHRIAAELRLWDAIEQHYLTPFWYFGIHDGMDLSQIPWRRGIGYDVEKLEKLYTGTDRWAKFVLHQYLDRTSDPKKVKALGFCVTVEHAKYMARIFREGGVNAIAVSAASSNKEREAALRDLSEGAVNVLFSVDLFNEGVDVPAVDSLLLLRPTESATLFLQQLGRGLRKVRSKEYCLVLDFVGRHRQEFRFDKSLRAILGGSRKSVEQQVEQGFPLLPSGCAFELDKKSTEIILESLKNSLPSTWRAKVAELKAISDADRIQLAQFLEESGLELEDVYVDGKTCWSQLREDAGLTVNGAGPAEQVVRRALGRLLHVNDMDRIQRYKDVFENGGRDGWIANSTERQRRAVRMLLAQLLDQVPRQLLPADATIQQGLAFLSLHKQVCGEGVELMNLLRDRIDHTVKSLKDRENVPLLIHAVYTRAEILAAFGHGNGLRTTSWQAGVLKLDEENVDLLAVTLDKNSGNFSPKTRYKDYAISPTIFHWESQSRVRAESDTGLRYQHHESMGREVLIFARLRAGDRGFWFLGPASYRSHRGELPMGIEWELTHPLPSDLFAQFAVAAA